MIAPGNARMSTTPESFGHDKAAEAGRSRSFGPWRTVRSQEPAPGTEQSARRLHRSVSRGCRLAVSLETPYHAVHRVRRTPSPVNQFTAIVDGDGNATQVLSRRRACWAG